MSRARLEAKLDRWRGGPYFWFPPMIYNAVTAITKQGPDLGIRLLWRVIIE